MTSAARTEQPGTAVATQTEQRIESTRNALRERNALVAAIRGTQWGRDTSPDMARAVAHYCYENGLDPVRHVEILGGRIYLTAEFYDEKGAHLIRSGVVRPEEPQIISADERLDKLAKDGDAWAKEEIVVRTRARIQHGVPEGAKGAVVQRFWIADTDTVILGVNWCGVPGKKDPVGEAEPTKTALTRARRRAWKQIADVVPGYGEIVKPLEATARVASEALPVSIVEPTKGPKPLLGSGEAGYGEATSGASAAAPESQEDGELALGDDLAPVRQRRNAQLD